MTNTLPAPTSTTPARILEVNHPYVTVEGLGDVAIGELVVFPDETLGEVLSYTSEVAQVISFGTQPSTPGDSVARLYQQIEFGIHPGLMGGVYSPLGKNLLTDQVSTPSESRPLDQEPVPLNQRHLLNQTLVTQVSLVDQLLPLGRGQRQVITGDRKTGKTTFAMNTAIAQAQQGAVVVYALIGKKSSEIAQVYNTFKDAGVHQQVVILASSASDQPSLVHITPLAAMTVAEYYRDQGKHVLVVLDDLSTHAKFYRQLALLAKQFPGRDSYPGDIFSVHARLLERAGCFNAPTGSTEESVSITCLPLAETTNSDLTDYIVSNLISITDGHLLFDDLLFQQGQRPAIHTSLSVTRVGKQTLPKVGRDINQKMNTLVAEYQRTQELSHFGTELREESKAILKRGTVLMDFFSMDIRLPLSLQYVLIGTIWLDWWDSKPDTNITPEIEYLLDNYTHKSDVQVWIDGLITSTETFPDFVDRLTLEKEKIIALCRP